MHFDELTKLKEKSRAKLYICGSEKKIKNCGFIFCSWSEWAEIWNNSVHRWLSPVRHFYEDLWSCVFKRIKSNWKVPYKVWLAIDTFEFYVHIPLNWINYSWKFRFSSISCYLHGQKKKDKYLIFFSTEASYHQVHRC